MRQRLHVLDVEVLLTGPDAVLAPIVAAYRRFVRDSPDTPSAHRVRIEIADDLRTAEIDGTRVEFLPRIEPAAHAYQIFLDRLMDGIGSHALLHAAALEDESGRAVLLAAPSGHGKTSLTLELAHRGFGFLGDDYAPLDLDGSKIEPYPRAVGLVPDGGAPIPLPFREALSRPGPTLMGKRLIDMGEVLGEARLVHGGRPLAHVVLLSADERGATLAETRLTVGARAVHAEELAQVFQETAGVRVLERRGDGNLALWRLALAGEAGATAALVRVLESDRVLFTEKSWDTRPGFMGAPAAQPVSRREAAELLGRELLNRRGRGRLLAAHGGRLAALFVDLAGALAGARCWRVRVGNLAATADLVTELTRG